MQVDVVSAQLADKAALANLLELYTHDFTEFYDGDVGDDGRFGYSYLDSYWTDDRRTPLLVRVDGKLAGFVLLQRGSHLTGDPDIMHITEFFVMRKYRRRGIGEQVACRVFDRFPGRWEVSELARNLPAQAFWRTVIGRYTHGRFEERPWDDERWRGPVQSFDNTGAVGAPRN
jgi:predicted acetyltransferase